MAKRHREVVTPGRRGPDAAILAAFVLGFLLVCLPGWAQEEEEGEFRGAGIHIKLRGAWVLFDGGDLETGTAGMFDRYVDEVVSAGFELSSSDKGAFREGYEIAGDVVYYFTPRIGIGAGGSLIRGRKESTALFRWPDGIEEYRLMSLPEMKVISLRLGLFYALPLNRLLAISISAGPEYHIASYKYSGTITTPYSAGAVVQRVDAQQLGLYAGLGLEIRMNRRLAFCLGAFGRYAKISGFEGNEMTYEWAGGQSSTINEQGTLYFFKGDQHPKLEIPAPGSQAGQDGRKAVFDLSGVSLQVGLNFKF